MQTSQEFAKSKPHFSGEYGPIQAMFDDRKIVGTRLARLRRALGFDEQQDFARALGLGKSTYCLYENGDRALTLRAADRIRARYGVPLDWLFYGDESSLTVSLAQKIRRAA